MSFLSVLKGIGKVALGTAEGFIAGGPAGAVVGGGTSLVGTLQGGAPVGLAPSGVEYWPGTTIPKTSNQGIGTYSQITPAATYYTNGTPASSSSSSSSNSTMLIVAALIVLALMFSRGRH